MKFAAVLLCCSILIKDVHVQNEEGDTCVDNENEPGICKPADQCSQVTENLKKNIFPKICGFRGIVALVCCRTTSVMAINIFNNATRIPGEISEAKCKEYAKYAYRTISSPLLTIKPQFEKLYDCQKRSEILSIGTLLASIEDYPYVAHIGFKSEEENSTESTIEYSCGGSLISENFVLTVAHCFINRHGGPPVTVRFGVANINNYKNRQEIRISDYHIYPNYTNTYNDIALVKLEKSVEFNKFVRPACLNTVRNISYKTAIVTGWGRTHFLGEPSDDLLKSILAITTNKKCNHTYKKTQRLKYGIVEDLMICAEITSDQRKDPCQGDSGSALAVSIDKSQELQCMSLIIGITSLGKACGFVGVPGVYTRVSRYIDWIEQIVWPDNI